MTGTFSSFNTALSALRYNRVAMDTASGNIANVSTEGYARRRVEAESAGGPARAALWSRYDGHGDGVRVRGVTRMTDALVDARRRTEHGNQSYLDSTGTILDRVEAGFGEPGPNGVAAALDDFRVAWHDVAIHSDSTTPREQLLQRAQTLASGVQARAAGLTAEAANQQTGLTATLSEVNTVAADLAATNRSVAIGSNDGSDISTLLDQRDLLALRLAELTGGTAVEGPRGSLDVRMGGISLVTGDEAGQLVQSPGTPVAFSVVDASGTPLGAPAGLKGEVGAAADLINTRLPGLRDELNAFAATLADTVNAQHAQGYDLAGAPGGAVFGYTPGDAAGSLTVVLTDPRRIAASGVPGGGVDGGNAEAMTELGAADEAYRGVVGALGSQVAAVTRLAATQQVLTDQLDSSHDQLAGVNLDEEMANLVTAQRAFEAASRVITTVDAMLDTLINRTGLVR